MIKKLVFVLSFIVSIVALGGSAFGATPDTLVVQAWPEYSDDQVLFMETVKYPETTPLPIEVKLAIPKGAQVKWAGELLGDASQDIQVSPKVNNFEDYDEVAFTLTKSRIGQVEARWVSLKVEGQSRTLNFDWIQRYDAKETQIKFKAPTGSTDVKVTPTPSDVSTSPDGMKVYAATPIKLPVGEKVSYTMTYKRSTNAPAETLNQPAPLPANAPVSGGGGSGDASIWIAFVLIALTAAAIIFAIVYQKNRADA